MRPFAYSRPENVLTALALLDELGPDARALAGGTDLMVGLRSGKVRPRVVVDLKRVAEMRPGIDETASRLVIGATTVLTDILKDERVQRYFPALIEAASIVGSVQIRNRATLAGNLCNASPAADTAPALLVYDAVVITTRSAGSRRIPLADFFLGPGLTVLERGELVRSIELPVPDRPIGAAFGRLTRRRGVDLATINLCCSVDNAGITRFAYGAVGPRPFLVADESATLADPTAPATAKDEVLAALVAQTSPITDVRASREYRLAMLSVLSKRTLNIATARLAERRA